MAFRNCRPYLRGYTYTLRGNSLPKLFGYSFGRALLRVNGALRRLDDLSLIRALNICSTFVTYSQFETSVVLAVKENPYDGNGSPGPLTVCKTPNAHGAVGDFGQMLSEQTRVRLRDMTVVWTARSSCDVDIVLKIIFIGPFPRQTGNVTLVAGQRGLPREAAP
ncbi:hypothetical protein EVAR_63974_1 [Eumeta japonica]|uniref:Uncharacterized protein n=1 Tax=Eumeta variegata TaxID=151549 RepID=A0A4C1ZEI3_EUMVA|nr:hypothetical protein EVAR_63974_1 [Eumeta japonica]